MHHPNEQTAHTTAYLNEVQTPNEGSFDNCAGNKVVEFTDRTAAEVDEKIKERQERNKVLQEPAQ